MSCKTRYGTLHTITGLSTGGAERALYNVLAGGLASEFESTVISLRDRGTFADQIEALGVSVYTLGIRGSLSLPRVIYRLRRLAKEVKPDLIQGWMYHGNLAATLAASGSPTSSRVIWNIRQSLDQISKEKRLTAQVIRGGRAFSRSVDGIIYNSHRSFCQHTHFGFDAQHAHVIPNGFDLDEFRLDPALGQSVRAHLGVPQNALVVGHVARFHPMKDHPNFLRAAVLVAQKNSCAHFILVGKDVGPTNAALSDIIPKNLLDRFVFTGEQNDPASFMQAMDVLCSSSWSEAFPNVIGEAMACALPCVVTDVGDCAVIVDNTGIVVPPSDSQALAEGLLTMLEKSQAERDQLGHAARSRIKGHYALTQVVSRYTELYRLLLSDA